MDICDHHVAQRFKNHSVPIERSFVLERRRYDAHRVMAFAVPSAGMARVEVAVILNVKLGWRECRFEQCPNSSNPIGRAHQMLQRVSLPLHGLRG